MKFHVDHECLDTSDFLLSCHSQRFALQNLRDLGFGKHSTETRNRRGARSARVGAQSEWWPIIPSDAASAPSGDQRYQFTSVWRTSRERPTLRRAFSNHFLDFVRYNGISTNPLKAFLAKSMYIFYHRRSLKNKTGGAKACKIKLGGQRRKKVI